MKYWLVKSEPHVYPVSQLKKDGITRWDGIRNYQARNNLQAMSEGDLCLFYHSNEGREIVGLARVAREAYPDPADTSATWFAVDLSFEEIFPAPVTLAELKSVPALSNLELIRQSRLSVCPVRKDEFDLIIRLTHP